MLDTLRKGKSSRLIGKFSRFHCHWLHPGRQSTLGHVSQGLAIRSSGRGPRSRQYYSSLVNLFLTWGLKIIPLQRCSLSHAEAPPGDCQCHSESRGRVGRGCANPIRPLDSENTFSKPISHLKCPNIHRFSAESCMPVGPGCFWQSNRGDCLAISPLISKRNCVHFCK